MDLEGEPVPPLTYTSSSLDRRTGIRSAPPKLGRSKRRCGPTNSVYKTDGFQKIPARPKANVLPSTSTSAVSQAIFCHGKRELHHRSQLLRAPNFPGRQHRSQLLTYQFLCCRRIPILHQLSSCLYRRSRQRRVRSRKDLMDGLIVTIRRVGLSKLQDVLTLMNTPALLL